MSIRKVECPNCHFKYELVTKQKIQRSNPQNRYFHGVVLPIVSRHTGYELDETKDLLKSMFCKKEFMLKTKNGVKEVSVVLGSSELKTDEFEKFMEDVRRWAASELQCYIPEPNEEG